VRRSTSSAETSARDHVDFDSSALVKLVVSEPESAALREFLKGHAARLSSGLAEVEVPRALRLRSLDAIHLATALSLGQDLAGIVTYDQRLAEAAIGADLEVWAPA
jgi:predicted nucleic acid-binding protein